MFVGAVLLGCMFIESGGNVWCRSFWQCCDSVGFQSLSLVIFILKILMLA